MPDMRPADMRSVAEVVAALSKTCSSCGKPPFHGVEVLPPPPAGQMFRDRATIVICPTRGSIDWEIVESWLRLLPPANQRRIGPVFAVGYDVASAYNALIRRILADPVLSTWPYVLTVEDDNIQPDDAHIRLLETIESGPWDAVSGVYHVKDPDQRIAMLYGDPAESAKTGRFDFQPIDVDAVPEGQRVVEVNAIPMGCALWRMDLFRAVPEPWFVTVEDQIMVDGQIKDPSEIGPREPGKYYQRNATQDLVFCDRARRIGKRFAGDLRVQVGHKDSRTGEKY